MKSTSLSSPSARMNTCKTFWSNINRLCPSAQASSRMVVVGQLKCCSNTAKVETPAVLPLRRPSWVTRKKMKRTLQIRKTVCRVHHRMWSWTPTRSNRSQSSFNLHNSRYPFLQELISHYLPQVSLTEMRSETSQWRKSSHSKWNPGYKNFHRLC